MTEQQHPLTPPPELVREWHYEHGAIVDGSMYVDEYIATQSARWGFRQCIKVDAASLEDKLQKARDQELEACIDVILAHPGLEHPELLVEVLRSARRPKPPSLAEQALAKTEAILNDPSRALLTEVREALELNRRTLKRLQELEKGNA